VVDQPVFDYGTIIQGDKVEHRFTLTNVGDQVLEIRKVKTTCGCTVARDYPRELAPGVSAELAVAFNSAHKKGRQDKAITIFNNSETSGSYVLKMVGTVRELVALTPDICNFGSVAVGQVIRREMSLTNYSEQLLKLQVVPPDDPLFRVSVGEGELQPGASTKVTVEFTSNTDRTSLAKLAKIRTDHPRVPVLTIRIRARVQVPKQTEEG
jgi:uncharacterized cupredoxin-like copper-binding protein